APDSSTWRMMSAPAEPPGSRVTTTATASSRSRAASRSACVDLPAPSPPSRVMNRPRIRQLVKGWIAGSSPATTKIAKVPCVASLYLLRTGQEKADHELGRGIEGTARDAAHGDAFGRMQRYLEHEVVGAPYLERPDRLPFLHRRAHRSAVDDAR